MIFMHLFSKMKTGIMCTWRGDGVIKLTIAKLGTHGQAALCLLTHSSGWMCVGVHFHCILAFIFLIENDNNVHVTSSWHHCDVIKLAIGIGQRSTHGARPVLGRRSCVSCMRVEGSTGRKNDDHKAHLGLSQDCRKLGVGMPLGPADGGSLGAKRGNGPRTSGNKKISPS
jgi:hypothetical protein